MNEEAEAGVAPAEGGGEAVAETSDTSAVMAEGTESSASEDQSSPVNSLSGDNASEGSTPVSFPSVDDFGWDDWDGNSDILPEQMRPWSDRFQSHYQSWADKEISQRTADTDRMREIYDALLNGESDPRIAASEEKLTEWETKYGELEDQHLSTQKEYDDYRKGVDEAHQRAADEWVEDFKKDHAKVFEDTRLSNNFVLLLEEGWEPETAVQAVLLPDAVVKEARQAKADGVPDEYALRLAKGAKSAPSTPRPGARITSGATTPARSVEQAPLADETPRSFQDLRTLVARRALNPNRRR
jgi:hypothetical protein